MPRKTMEEVLTTIDIRLGGKDVERFPTVKAAMDKGFDRIQKWARTQGFYEQNPDEFEALVVKMEKETLKAIEDLTNINSKKA